VNDRSNQFPLDSDTLLAFVEGELDAATRVVVERSLATDPALRATVEGMIRDRLLLASLREHEAPASIASSVEAAINRSVLAAISDGVVLSDRPPVSVFVPARAERTLKLGPRGMRALLAAAAGMALLVSGTIIALAIRPHLQWRERAERLANATEPTNANANADTTAPAVASNVNTTEPAATDEPIVIAAVPDEAVPAVAVSKAAVPVTDIDRAIALAAEGRLVVRVFTSNVARAPETFERIVAATGDSADGRPWRLNSGIPVTMASAISMPRDGMREPVSRPTDAPVYADGSGDETQPTIITLPRPTEFPPVELNMAPLASGVVDVALSPAAFRSLRATLGERLGVGIVSVEFAECPPIPNRATPSAESLLWWTQPSGAWAPWVAVPVVVEGR